jgi:hypothetical protein
MAGAGARAECPILARCAIRAGGLYAPAALSLCGSALPWIELIVTDRNVVDSPELGLEIAAALHKLSGDKFQLNKIDTLLANRSCSTPSWQAAIRNASPKTGSSSCRL